MAAFCIEFVKLAESAQGEFGRGMSYLLFTEQV